MGNNLKTVALLGFLAALLVLVGDWLAPGGRGAVMGLVLAAVFNFGAYFYSDKIALRSTGARPASEAELPQVYRILRNLIQREGLPMPGVYLIDSPQPNAFATGRNPQHAAVAVTTGILGLMDEAELEGVLAHELAHVRNRDILISTIAATLAAALMFISRMALWFGGGRRREGAGALVGIVALLVAPIAAVLIKLAISRAREFQADTSGARLTGQPLNLARALEKLEAGTSRVPMRVNEAVSPLFIADPMKALRGRGGLTNLFATHPPVPERVERLRRMASGIR